jgi:hypothetical protein
MSATFPRSLVLRYPVTQTVTAPVDVVEFLDGSEQRWREGDFLQAFELTFSDVPIGELAALRTFWTTVKGAFDGGNTFGFQGVDYPDMVLESDDLTEVESTAAEKVTVTVKLRQTAPHGAYSGAAPATYPPLYGAVVAQRPLTTRPRWCTTRNDLASGARYSWAEWPAPRAAWTLEYPCLTATELATRLAFFVAVAGRYRSFSFADPATGTLHSPCRLDSDALPIRWLGAGQCAVTLSVTEYVA